MVNQGTRRLVNGLLFPNPLELQKKKYTHCNLINANVPFDLLYIRPHYMFTNMKNISNQPNTSRYHFIIKLLLKTTFNVKLFIKLYYRQ